MFLPFFSFFLQIKYNILEQSLSFHLAKSPYSSTQFSFLLSLFEGSSCHLVLLNWYGVPSVHLKFLSSSRSFNPIQYSLFFLGRLSLIRFCSASFCILASSAPERTHEEFAWSQVDSVLPNVNLKHALSLHSRLSLDAVIKSRKKKAFESIPRYFSNGEL